MLFFEFLKAVKVQTAVSSFLAIAMTVKLSDMSLLAYDQRMNCYELDRRRKVSMKR